VGLVVTVVCVFVCCWVWLLLLPVLSFVVGFGCYCCLCFRLLLGLVVTVVCAFVCCWVWLLLLSVLSFVAGFAQSTLGSVNRRWEL
jgi:hypothetical protein